MPLKQHTRTRNSPSPIYGISPGFNVGDLDRAYTPPVGVLGTFATSPGDWAGDPGYLTSQATTTQTSSPIQTYARAVKIAVNVSGTGSITVVVKSAVDSYSAVVATYTTLTAGSYQFFLGGYGSPQTYAPSVADGDNVLGEGVKETTPGGPDKVNYPTSDGTSYVATRYGPVGANSEATSGLKADTDNNYSGGTYNPFQFLSLDGYALEFTATVTGTVGYDIEVMPIS